MKGIILAGGSGTRLHPMTSVISKQLLPIYDKPMIYYPLTTLMLAGVKDILLISTPDDLPLFRRLLGDGQQWGISISYAVQPQPAGLAQAYTIAADWLAGEPSILVLGDNIFFGYGFSKILHAAIARDKPTIFAYQVTDPERFGVVEFDANGQADGVVEKPWASPSNWAITGIYFFNGDAPRIAAGLKPSKRGELEIVDMIRVYLARGQLHVEKLCRAFMWLDTGTPESLLKASNFVAMLGARQSFCVASPEEIAFRNRWIPVSQLMALGNLLSKSAYGQYLISLAEDAP